MGKITLKGVKKTFDKTPVLHGIDLEIGEKEFVALVGPSGCGKTTLLRMIAGLEETTEGEIFIDDHLINFVPPARRGIAMVFQSYALYPHMTVYDNMAFGLKMKKASKEEIRTHVMAAAKTLQIEKLLERKPKQLSGGQRQRVAIGRAIVRDPKAFLFDEPLSNLDASLRVQMRMELANLKAQLRSTMVYVTHDQVEAMTLADKIVVMRDGNVEQVGHPLELYHNPTNKFVAGFIGSPQMNFIPAVVTGRSGDHVQLNLGEGTAPLSLPVFPGEKVEIGDELTLGIRPEHLTLEGLTDHHVPTKPDSQVHIKAEVVVVEYLGSESYCHARVASGQILIFRLPAMMTLESGQAIEVTATPSHCYLFNTQGKTIVHGEAHLNRQKFEKKA